MLSKISSFFNNLLLKKNVSTALSISNEKDNNSKNYLVNSLITHKKVFILTREHCNFIAQLIQKQLSLFGISAEIIDKEPKSGFSKLLHFVICPQIYEKRPKNFIAIQMEQAVAKRWFTEEYFNILKSAKLIFDYSMLNIDFLKQNGLSQEQIYFMPIFYNGEYFIPKQKIEEEYDIVFYGDENIERRLKFLNAINTKFKVKIINKCYGEDLYRELSKAKIIINIHYYEGAFLETTRIYECLSLNKLIISETATDIEYHQNLNNIVEFTALDNEEEMLAKITYWLADDERRNEKIKQNIKLLYKQQDLFSFHFNRFLLTNNIINFDEFTKKTSHESISNDIVKICSPELNYKIQFKNNSLQHLKCLSKENDFIKNNLNNQYLLFQAAKQNLDYLIICSNNIELRSDFDLNIKNIKSTLLKKSTIENSISVTNEVRELNTTNDISYIEYVYINDFHIYTKKL
jgi:hypothetical protein